MSNPPPGGFGPPPPSKSSPKSEAPPPKRSTHAFATDAPGAASLPAITRGDQIKASDGARVRVIGTYVEIDARMAQRPPPRYVGHAAIKLADGATVSLLPVWDPDALRPEAEAAAFRDTQVEAVGILRATAPAEPHGGASPIGPALTKIEALRAAR